MEHLKKTGRINTSKIISDLKSGKPDINQMVKKITGSLWTSKLRFGQNLCNDVRTEEDQPKNTDMILVQKAQNRKLRVLTKTCRVDLLFCFSQPEKRV
jgi:hypothetical protein